MTYLMNKKEPGQLTKDYTRNPEVDGPNCDSGGMARDIIFTAINLGTFGISANDPQIPHWFSGPSPVCGTSQTNEESNSNQNPNETPVPMGVVNIGSSPNNQPTGVTTPPNKQ
jgi:hypothetical protein